MELVVDNPRTSPYAEQEGYKGNGFGWASDMMHIAVNRDDAEAFMRFLSECGGPECKVLLAGSIENYAALHGSVECLKAIFAAGVKSDYPLDYWLKKAEKPSYGPRASRLPTAA